MPIGLPPGATARKKPKGKGVNLDWRADFLRDYEAHGGFYHAAQVAGVNSSTVYRECERNADFRAATEEAKQRFADSQERQLQTLGQQGNVVGPIVLLKKHRPHEYIEKNLTLTASFSAELSGPDATALLRAMLSDARPSTTQALEP